MPFDPNSPFDPSDPAQRWRLQNLPHTLVQPKPPPGTPFGNSAGDDGPDDWFVPEADGFPNDWIRPDNNNAPSPSVAPPAPSPQPNPTVANSSLEHLDPYRAFWSQMPASRAGAMAWHPPVFLSPDRATWLPPFPTFPHAFGRSPPAANMLAPGLGPGGIPDGIGGALAEQTRTNDPLVSGIFGVPRVVAPSAWPDPMSLAAARLMFGSPANLQPAAANTPAAPSSLPMSRRFLPPDAIGLQGARNPCGYAGNDPLNRGETTGFAAGQPAIETTPPITTPFPDAWGLTPGDSNGAGDTPEALGSQYHRYGQAEGFPTQLSPDVSRPPIRLVNDTEPEEKLGAPFPDHDHLKSDPYWFLNPFGESNSIAGRIGWGAGTPSTALVPYRAPPLPVPLLRAPQPSPRLSPPPPASPPPAGLSPASPVASGPRLSTAPIESDSATLPSQESDGGVRAKPDLPPGIGSGPFAGEQIPAGPGKRPSPTQQDQINASGDKYGCHTCGAPDPGTRSGNWIGDHQTPTALNPDGQQQFFLPHCWFCSPRQGGLLRSYLRQRGK